MLLAPILLAVLATLTSAVRITSNPGDDEDPTVLLAQDGRFHVAWWSNRDGQVDLFTRSSRNGQTWSDEQRITNDADEDFYPSLVQARDGVFHLAWFRLQRAAGRVDIWYTRSADGTHWAAPVAITAQGQNWAPTIYEATRGVLWIVWSSWRAGNRELFASRSTDSGRHWTPPQRLTNSAEEDDFPHVSKMAGGKRVLVWTRYAPGSPLLDYFKDGTAEIVMATSRDGLHWSAPAAVSPADPDGRYVEFLPFVFSDRDGSRTYVSWTSNRARIDRGDILVRQIFSPSSPVRTLVEGGYDAKVVASRRRGEFLIVWISGAAGTRDIFAQRVHLLPTP